MKKTGGLMMFLLSILMFFSLFSATAHAFDVSGSVNYSGSKTGRIYLKLQGNGQYGTSVAATGSFTIRGVPNGTYMMTAFRDVQGTGSRHVTDPSGFKIDPITVAGANVTGAGISLGDPTTVTTPAAPVGFAVLPAENSALVMWGTNTSSTVAEDAESYDIYWGTSPDPGPSPSTSTGSILNIPAVGEDGTIFLTSLNQPTIANGSALYFSLYANISGQAQSAPTKLGPITIGNPVTSGVTVNGTVNYTGGSAPGVPLLIALVNASDDRPTNFYAGVVQIPTAGNNSFSIINVPDGTYELHAILDINNNAIMDIGDISSGNARNIVSVSGGVVSGQTAVIINDVNAEASVRTNHWKDVSNESYNLNIKLSGMKKRPVLVALTGAATAGASPLSYITGPIDLGLDGVWGFYTWLNIGPNVPVVGDVYTFNVTYADLTTGDITGTVTGVLDSPNFFATPTSPVASQTYSATPTFTWTAPTTLPAVYTIYLNNQSGGGSWDSNWIPNNQISETFANLFPSQPTLANNSSYNWSINASDLLGNSASYGANFSFGTPSTPGALSITTSSLPQGVLSTSYSQSLSATGGTQPYSWSLSSGSLPPGLTMTGNTISGTPTVAGGPYSFVVQLQDASSATVTRTLSIEVLATAPVWVVYNANPTNKNDIDWLQTAHSLLPAGSYIRINGTYYYTSPAGGPSYWNNSSLYWGNGFYSCNQTTGALLYVTSVVPPMPVPPDLSGTAGMTIEFFASWAATGNSSAPLSIATTSLPDAVAGYFYSQQLYGNGGTPPYTFSVVSGTLPAGISLNSNGTVTGTTSAAGAYPITVQITDSTVATATQSLSLTVTAPTPSMTWGGVFHYTRPDGTQWDAIDIGANVTASSLGTLTATVSGPNGFSYTFTDLDVIPYLNGKLEVYKEYASTTPLSPGVYTFTLDDGQGHVTKRVDTFANPVALPIVDSATIQKQRKADGSYRISWAPVNATTTYHYRVKIQKADGTRIPVYFGPRQMDTTEDIPIGTLVDGTAYQIRVEVHDSPTADLSFNRSNSAYVNFTPLVADYDANRVIINYVNISNRTESDNTTKSVWVGIGFKDTVDTAKVTSAWVEGPNGFRYDFILATDISSGTEFVRNGSFAIPPVTGSYTFHAMANGLDHVAYATLTAPASLPVPDLATYKAEELSNGSFRFSWADVDYTGALYYRVVVRDSVTGQLFYTPRANQMYADLVKTTLGDLTNKMWRVEVFDSSSITTVRNRTNGPWATAALLTVPAYDSTLPVIGGFGIVNERKPNGTSRTHLWLGATDLGGTITQLKVDGPNGYTRNMLTQGYLDGTVYRIIENGSPEQGLYTFTAFDSSGNTVKRYNYQPAATAIPIVDYKTFALTTEPNGDVRFSWAPVASDLPLWYSLETFTNTDVDNNGQIDLLFGTNLYTYVTQTSLVVPANVLSQPNIMFRVLASDGSNSMTNNNRSRSVLVGYQGVGFNYASLTDADGDNYASNVDPNDNDATVYPLAPTSSDTQAPSVPTGLYAQAISSNQINLNWGVSTDNVGVTYYKVFRNGSTTPAGAPAGATNTFWPDNSLQANTTYAYSVAACDAAGNCSAPSATLSITTPSGTTSTPVDITGTISYSGTKTGRVYVFIQTDYGSLGTSVAWPVGTTSVTYTIRGVPSNNLNNNINAFMDIADKGARSASSPAGTLTGSTSVKNVILNDPTAATPAAPTLVEVKPGAESVFIMWQPNEDVNGVVDADSYDVFWSTSPQVLANITGSKLDLPVGMDSPLVINGLTDGSVLYFQVVAKRGTYQAASTVTSPITVGATTGLNTVSGTVTYNGTPTGPLYVAVVVAGNDKGMGSLFYKSIASPSSNQAFSVSGVPDGNYQVYAILDMNNDGMFAGGDVTNTDGDQAPIITLSGNSGKSGITIPLVAKNSEVEITTDHGKNLDGTSVWYSVNGRVSGMIKRPVTVTLTGKPASYAMAIPMDIGLSKYDNNEFEFWIGGSSTVPVVGDTYTFSVAYSDGTVETVTGAVTGISNSFPTNPGISSPISTTPLFSWDAPTVAPSGNYQYSLWVGGNNNNNMWDAWSIPGSQNQIVYGSGSNSSAAPLQTNTQYYWNISTRDQNGNRATVQSLSFTPTVVAISDSVAPYIVSTAPANNATGVSTNTQFSVTFSEEITGMPSELAVLKNNTTGQYIPGLGSGSGLTLTFTPSVLLDPGTSYSIVFSTVTDLAGNPLPPTTLSFTTAGGVVTDITPPVTTASPVGGLFTSAQSVALSVNETATIYYTTDGTDPTTSSAVYSTPISISATTTLKYFAKDAVGNSETVKSAVYTIDTTIPVTTASPLGGLYNAAQSVTLTVNKTATVYYTTNGSTPTTASPVYSGAIAISATTTLKYFAKDVAGNSETVKSAVYTIDTLAPVTSASLAAGVYTTAQTVTLTANEAATIYFTTNGATPNATSLVYSRPLVIGATTTLKFFARDSAGNTEAVQGILYTIDTTLPVTTASPAGGIYSSAQNVALLVNELAVTYYTTDGTVPSTSSLVYSGPIPVSTDSTLKFFSVDTAGNSNAVQSAGYTIDNVAPTLISTIPDMLVNTATDVSIGTKISVTFSKAVKGLPELTAVLKNNATGLYVPGTGAASADNMTYTFIPTAQLLSSTTYSIHLATVTDMAGNALPDTTLTFTTAAAVMIDVTPPLSTASIAGGVYSASQSVVLNANEAAKIYYTTDGTVPSTASVVYSTPVPITATTKVKFFAVDTVGNKEIDVNSVQYIIVPSGDINQDDKVDIADAYKMLEIAVGRVDRTTADLRNADVAPLINGIPTPDGVIGVSDVVVLLRRIVGSVTW